MRLIDADKLKHIYPNDKEFHNVINHARTVKAIPASVIDDIIAEIEKDMGYYANVRNNCFEEWCVAKRSGLNRSLEIIDSKVKKVKKGI